MPEETTSDIVGDNPFVSLKAKKSRQRRGIGDNSEKFSATSDEKGFDETISALLSSARGKAVEYDATVTSGTAAIRRKAAETVSAIFDFAHALHTAGADAAFRAKYGILGNANVQNASHHVVAFCFVQIERPYVKSTVSKWSAVISHGIASGLSPEQFADLVRASGIENIYKQCKPSTQKDALTEQQHEELAKAVLPDRPDAPVFSDPEIFGDSSGDRLAVVTGDGAGNFRVRTIFDHSPQEVSRFLSAIARKRLAQ